MSITASGPLSSPSTDGRRLRSERNRDAVVEAILSLLRAGNQRPSSAEIAERAGVSLRSVFRHFDDLDTLMAAAVARQQEDMAPYFGLTVPVGPKGRPAPLAVRVEALVAHRAELYEVSGAVRVVAERHRTTSEPIADGLDRVHRLLRRQLPGLFAPELDRRVPAGRKALLADLDAVTSFAVWRQLRDEQKVSVARARTAMARLVHAVVAG